MPQWLTLHVYACFLGGALVDVGDAMKRMAEVKDALDIDVKQNFIDPLQAIADKDIKDIQVELKTRCASAHTDLVLSCDLYSQYASCSSTENHKPFKIHIYNGA